ncbi:MAG: hypothetical protein ACYCS7_04480 [Acidimicrobiales bacterium]
MGLVGAYGARGAYIADGGARTMSSWLVERLGLSHVGATELARASIRPRVWPYHHRLVHEGGWSISGDAWGR